MSKKKTPKEASQLFESIMKASVKDNAKAKSKKEKICEWRYKGDFYQAD